MERKATSKIQGLQLKTGTTICMARRILFKKGFVQTEGKTQVIYII